MNNRGGKRRKKLCGDGKIKGGKAQSRMQTTTLIDWPWFLRLFFTILLGTIRIPFFSFFFFLTEHSPNETQSMLSQCYPQ